MTTVVEEFVAKLGWDVDSRELRTFQHQAQGLKDTARSAFYGATIAATGLAAAIWKVSSAFSVIEDAEAAFTPLLGGAERAATMVERLNTMAAKTPFEFADLAGATKQLLPSMGGDIDQTIASIQMLGDAAQGNAQKMQSVVRGYNRILIKGKANLEGLNIIAEAGVPIYDQLTKVLGYKSGEQMFAAVSAGKISAEEVTKTFKAMTSEGGIFFRGMEIASETLSGKISTLRDDSTMALAAIGKELSPTLKDVVDELSGVAQNVGGWAKANGALIRIKFREYVQDVRDFIKDLVSFGGKVRKVIDDFGGFVPTLKFIATGFAAIKLAPFLDTMISITRRAPTMGTALADAAGVAAKGWGTVALILAAIPYVVEDLQKTWEWQDSIIQRYVVDPIIRAWGAYDGLNERQIRFTKEVNATFMKGLFGENWYDPILKGFEAIYKGVDWLGVKINEFFVFLWGHVQNVKAFFDIFTIGGGIDNAISKALGFGEISFDKVRNQREAGLTQMNYAKGLPSIGVVEDKNVVSQIVNRNTGIRQTAKTFVIQSTPKVNISVSSNAADPKAVAEVVDERIESAFARITENMVSEAVAAQ